MTAPHQDQADGGDRHAQFAAVMSLVEQLEPLVEMAAAIRRQFEAAGFTNEAAGLLTVDVIREANARRHGPTR